MPIKINYKNPILYLVLFLVIALITYIFSSKWENLYYFYAGLGGILTIIAIFATYLETQKQIKKDIFLRSTDFTINELHACIVEISHYWTPTAYNGYMGKLLNSTVGWVPGHQNQTTLAIHTLSQILEKSIDGIFTPTYEGASQNQKDEIKKRVNEYIEKFKYLLDQAKELGSGYESTYKNSYLGRLNTELTNVLPRL